MIFLFNLIIMKNKAFIVSIVLNLILNLNILNNIRFQVTKMKEKLHFLILLIILL